MSAINLAPEEDEAAPEPPVRAVAVAVGSVVLACAVVLMAAQVIMRFGFNSPQAWAEEVDRYLFLWSVYLGATVALMKGTHVRVTFVVDLFGPGGETFAQWLTRAIGILAFGFTAYQGFVLAWVERDSEFYTLPGVPQALFYLAAPVGLTLMTLYLVVVTIRDLASRRSIAAP